MPKRERVRGVGEKEQRMYEHIKEDSKTSAPTCYFAVASDIRGFTVASMSSHHLPNSSGFM